jgi:DNA polymerase-3 subunit delta'
MLVGQEEQRADFGAALAGGRVHHAWLLTGARGLGKRAFADWAALEVLAGGDPESAGGRLLAAGSHPDFRLLEPPEEGRGAATRSIIVDQVRELQDFLTLRPALGEWRVLVIDAADNLNEAAANALLKSLEEPGGSTLFLLVAHAPSLLRPTIRSRCRRLAFRPVEDGAVAAGLRAARPGLDAEAVERLVGLARGSPGEALRLAETEAHLLADALERERPTAFARSFQGAGAAERFEILCAIAPRVAAARARATGDPADVARYEHVSRLAADAPRGAYDRAQVAAVLAMAMASGAGRRA